VANVIDGGIDLVTSANTILSGIPFEFAHPSIGLERGTFARAGRSEGDLDGVQITGSWTCG
jgi:hypothetical protein